MPYAVDHKAFSLSKWGSLIFIGRMPYAIDHKAFSLNLTRGLQICASGILYYALGDHGLGYFHEAGDVGAFYVIDISFLLSVGDALA